jgi:Zn-dependent M28 family amino/carboxypeptidase
MTLGTDEKEKIPEVHVGESVINVLFGSVDSLRKLQTRIDDSMAPVSFAFTRTDASVRTSTSIKVMTANNVVGFLEGSDPALKNQVVVVGAHYDHVGYKKQHTEGEDYIFNGADDNASGTCAVLGVAAGLGSLPSKPKRSILLMAFAGEEKGLYGSLYYTNHPLLSLESTVAMLNIDMVGRNGRDSLLLIGGEASPDIDSIARVENARVGFVLVDDILTAGGSDHMSFQKKNIPSLFFHSGLHADLHKVTDNPDKIDVIKLTQASRLVFLTAVHIANDTHRYRYFSKPISLF